MIEAGVFVALCICSILLCQLLRARDLVLDYQSLRPRHRYKMGGAAAANALPSTPHKQTSMNVRRTLISYDGPIDDNVRTDLLYIDEDKVSSLPPQLEQILRWSLDFSHTIGTDIDNVAPEVPLPDHTYDAAPSYDEVPLTSIDTIELLGSSLARPASDLTCESRSATSSASTHSHEPRSKSKNIKSILGKLKVLKTSHAKTEGENGTSPISSTECTSCFDEIPLQKAKKLPCSHSYCAECLRNLVTTAMTTESSFPPKCCLSPIPLHVALLALNSKQRLIYKEKAAEYAVPAQERWYCPNTKCLRWISPSKVRKLSSSGRRCPHCAHKICTVCRGAAHEKNSECPQDFGLEATLTMAELEGWMRCEKCRALVEVGLLNSCCHPTDMTPENPRMPPHDMHLWTPILLYLRFKMANLRMHNRRRAQQTGHTPRT
jgi:hypothetical protein